MVLLDSQRLGQGRENAKTFLKTNPDIAARIEAQIRQNAGLLAERILDNIDPPPRTRTRASRRGGPGPLAGRASGSHVSTSRPRASTKPASVPEGMWPAPHPRSVVSECRPDEWRQRDPFHLPRLFRPQRPRGRRVEPARAAQRPDPHVHQCGMVQFKNDFFTGVEKRPYSNGATSQKCVRAGGKHNDLDNVGYTARHHTFFEMLGNFSFGDYFQGSRHRARLEPRHEGVRLPKDRLMVTVFHEDDEAHGLWKKIAGLPDSKIVRNPTSDNFLGDGRHGSLRAVLRDLLRPRRPNPRRPARSPDQDGDRFIEIWNLVFCSSSSSAPASASRCPSPPSTPAWASSASRRCCRARTTTTRLT